MRSTFHPFAPAALALALTVIAQFNGLAAESANQKPGIDPALADSKDKPLGDLINERALQRYVVATNRLARSEALASVDLGQSLTEGIVAAQLLNQMADFYPSSDLGKQLLDGKPIYNGRNFQTITNDLHSLLMLRSVIKSPTSLAHEIVTMLPADDREGAYEALAQRHARLGQINAAQHFAQLTKDASKRGVESIVIESLVQLGRPDEAVRIASQVPANVRPQALANAARALAVYGDIARARTVAGDLPADAKARLLIKLDLLAVKTDKKAALGKIVASLPKTVALPPAQRARALTDLADGAARAGDKDLAKLLIRQVFEIGAQLPGKDQTYIAVYLVGAIAGSGDTAKAAELSKELRFLDKASAQGSIAAGLAAQNDLEAASVFLREAVNEAAFSGNHLWQLTLQGILGDFILAATDAPSLKGLRPFLGDTPESAAEYVCGSLEKLGDSKKAEQLARGLTDPAAFVFALSGIADASAQNHHPQRADALLAEAYAKLKDVPASQQAACLGALITPYGRAGVQARVSQLYTEAQNLTRSYEGDACTRALAKIAERMVDVGRRSEALETVQRAALYVNHVQPKQKLFHLLPLTEALAHFGEADFPAADQPNTLTIHRELMAAK